MSVTGGAQTREIADLLALGVRAAEAYERPDLGERLATVAGQIADDRARVLVVGEFKAGKTELVNALVSARVLPADPHRSTTVPTLVEYAETPGARLVRPHESDTALDLSALADHVTEKGNPGNAAGWSHAVVGATRGLLAAGVVLVDTPGAGGLGSPASLSTMAELPGADAVVLVSDAGREFTAPEMAMLRTAAAVCPTVVAVLTRIDLHPHWRTVVDLDRAHLAEATLGGVELVATSAALRLAAVESKDAGLDAESGIGQVAEILSARVGDDRARRRARLVADEVLAACGQMLTAFRAELAGLADPRRAEQLARDIEARRAKATGLRDRAARWQQTLNDGTADLVSDIEYDLRDRLRAVTADAEDALDDTDPAKTWEQFAPWLHQQVSSACATNMVWAEERTRWLAERVAEHFAEDGAGMLPDFGERSGQAADLVGLLAAPDHEKFGLGQSLLVGMRGSYGGVLMIGMLTTVAGMALLNPFSVGAGLLLGSKTLLDERKRALRRRQMEAKAAVRRHVDDVTFQVGKNSRDMLREVQRTLRDHFTATATELDRSLTVSAAAVSAIESAGANTSRRRADLEAEIERVEGLEERARALRASVGGGAAPPPAIGPPPEAPPATTTLGPPSAPAVTAGHR